MSSLAYRRLRAPTWEQGYLIEPAWPSLVRSLRGPSTLGLLSAAGEHSTAVGLAGLRSHTDIDWSGRRRQARREVGELLQRRSASFGPAPTTAASPLPISEDVDYVPWVVGGHQPQLFHPGVWFKNFVLSDLAAEVQGIGLNVVIDNDLCRATSMRVPTGSRGDARSINISFDTATSPTPYEDRRLIDRPLWDSFAERVLDMVPAELPEPLLARWWPTCVAAQSHLDHLGGALAAARHDCERRWGLTHHEVALSQLCRLDSFGCFALELLSRATDVRDIYNGALQAYRQVHHIRSTAHPAPDLRRHGAWCEVPFWIWEQRRPVRRPAFVRQSGSRLELGDGDHVLAQLPLGGTSETNRATAAAAWSDLQQSDVRFRPRALITTLYLRLWLADLFVHGIGGAKYDQVTDELVRAIYGLEPPGYAVATASLSLPLAVPRAAVGETRQLRQRLRELRFHPEHYLPSEAWGLTEVQAAVQSKQDLMALQLPAGPARRNRHAALVHANQVLRPWVDPQRDQIELALEQLQPALRCVQQWGSREFAFCLFPEPLLRERMASFLAHARQSN